MDKYNKAEVEKAEIAHIESNIESSSQLKIRKAVEKPDLLQQYTDEEIDKFHRKITLKVDLRLIPMLVLLYILNYLDRNNIASARLGGLEDDLNLKGNQYQTCISILFVGYILMQIPSNMFLNKFKKPSIFITGIMAAWGTVSTCTAAVQGFGGLLAIRLILGFVEAGFFGSCLYVLSCWYTRKQLGFRNSLLYSGSLLSGAFSGLIAAGIIDNMDNLHGLRSWRWLFIIEGAITVGIAPIAYFVLPDMPHNSKMLSDFEKDVLLYKIRCETGQDDSDETNEESYWGAFKLAVSDIKVWACCGILSWLVSAAGVTNFFPSIVETLDFNRVITLCLTAPPYILAVISTFIWALHADRTGERFWHVVLPLIVALIAFIIAVSTLNIGARYFSMVIMVPAIYCSFTTILSWMSNSCPRPPLKRAIALSLMNCLSNSASIWNAYLYPSSSAPRYTIAFACNCVFIGLAILCAIALRWRLQILNKRIENGTMNWEKELGKGNDGSEVKEDFRFLI
uniref:Membrane protein n=1 Tax=Candidozyma auris TaxID=498019 RepID=A0A0L0NVJ3_CANAR